jgi:hypothetical protein
MQYSVAAVIALAASTAAAGYTNGTVVYTTEVHTAYTTVCPASTELTFNGVTYTATAVSRMESGEIWLGRRVEEIGRVGPLRSIYQNQSIS